MRSAAPGPAPTKWTVTRSPSAGRTTGRPAAPGARSSCVPSPSARSTPILVSVPPSRWCQPARTAWPSIVTALATSLPPGASASQQAATHARRVTPPPMKTASGALSPASACGAGARDEPQPGHAEGRRVAGDPLPAVGARLDRDRAAGRVDAHPLDADAARPGAHVPQQLAGHRGERGEGQRPHLALGDLPVVLERVVRQPRGARQRRGGRVEAALDRDDRQAAVRPGGRRQPGRRARTGRPGRRGRSPGWRRSRGRRSSARTSAAAVSRR